MNLCPHGKMKELISKMGACQKQIYLVMFSFPFVPAVFDFDVVFCHDFSDCRK
jgi:hypothetical protein